MPKGPTNHLQTKESKQSHTGRYTTRQYLQSFRNASSILPLWPCPSSPCSSWSGKPPPCSPGPASCTDPGRRPRRDAERRPPAPGRVCRPGRRGSPRGTAGTCWTYQRSRLCKSPALYLNLRRWGHFVIFHSKCWVYSLWNDHILSQHITLMYCSIFKDYPRISFAFSCTTMTSFRLLS